MADPESNSWKRIFQRNSKFVYTFFFFFRTLLFRNFFRNVELNCIDRVYKVKMSEEESVSFEKRVSID